MVLAPLFLCGGPFSPRRHTEQRLKAGHLSRCSPENKALLPAVYCKLQSHNVYFLNKNKYYQQYIYIYIYEAFLK